MDRVGDPLEAGRLVVISGPSGVGKTTVCDELLKIPGFERVVTSTTRPPRGSEVDGRDYCFLSREDFEAGIRAGKFLEHARVHGQLYGTPRGSVERGLAEGKNMLLNIDVQGAAQIRRSIGAREPGPRASARLDPLEGRLVTIFLVPPDLAELRRRLSSRGTDAAAEVQARLEAAEKELQESGCYDVRVTNVDVDRTVREILDFMGYECSGKTGAATGARAQGGPGGAR